MLWFLLASVVSAQTPIIADTYVPSASTYATLAPGGTDVYTLALSQHTVVDVYVFQSGTTCGDIDLQLLTRQGSAPTQNDYDDRVGGFHGTTQSGITGVMALNADYLATTLYIGLMLSGGASIDCQYRLRVETTVWSENQALCDYNQMLSVVANYSTLLTQLRRASNPNAMNAIFGYTLQSVLNQMRTCINLARLALNPGIVTQIVNDTTRCYWDYGSTQYKNDPCCNIALQKTQCCIPRDSVTSRRGYPSFDPATIATCSSPELSGRLMLYFQDFITNTIPACQGQTQYVSTSYDWQRISQCLYGVQQMQYCQQDYECWSGVCGNFGGVGYKTCYVDYSEDQAITVLQCVLSFLDDFTVQYIRQSVGALGDPQAVFETKFSVAVSGTGVCVGPLAYPGGAAITNQVACELPKSCNFNAYTVYTAGSTVCQNNAHPSFCGLCAGQHCTEVSDFNNLLFDTQQKCTGYCQYNSQLTSAVDCPTINACSTMCNGQVCSSQADCTNLGGYCSGYLLYNLPGCIRPYRDSDYVDMGNYGYYACGVGESSTDLGCHDMPVMTENDCLAKVDYATSGWQWYSYPSTKAECLAVTGCKVPGSYGFTSKSGAACTACGGTMQPVLTWIPGVWSSRRWVPYTWGPRDVVNTNTWANNINNQKFYDLISGVQVARMSGELLKILDCGISPMIAMTQALACDCAAGSSSRECFTQTLTFPVGGTDCFSTTGCTAASDAIGLLSVSASSAPAGQSSVQVYSTPAQTMASASSTTMSAGLDSGLFRSLAVSSVARTASSSFLTLANGGTVTFGGQEVGVFVGSGLGYKFSSALRGNLDICLPVDPTIQVSAAYTAWDFGVLCGDGSVHAMNTAVTVSSLGVCGTVSATGNYYPVRRQAISGADSACTVVAAGQSANNILGGGSSSAAATTRITILALVVSVFVAAVWVM